MSKPQRKPSRRQRRRRVQGNPATTYQVLDVPPPEAVRRYSRMTRLKSKNLKQLALRKFKSGITPNTGSYVAQMASKAYNYAQSVMTSKIFGQPLTNASVFPTGFRMDNFTYQGVQGCRMTGCCAVAKIVAPVLPPLDYPFEILSLPTFNDDTIRLNPQVVFPAIAQEYLTTTGFTKFKFTQLKFWYGSLCPSNAVGGLAVSYYPDGAVNSGDFSYTTLISSPDTVNFSIWQSGIGADFSHRLDKSTWFYVDQDTGATSDAGWRQSYQGAIVGKFGQIPSTGFNQGTLYIEYVLELLEPRTNSDLALASSLSRVLLPEDRKDLMRSFRNGKGIDIDLLRKAVSNLEEKQLTERSRELKSRAPVAPSAPGVSERKSPVEDERDPELSGTGMFLRSPPVFAPIQVPQGSVLGPRTDDRRPRSRVAAVARDSL